MGVAWLDRGEPNKAMEYLNKSLQIESRSEQTLSNLGYAWFLKGDFDRAIRICTSSRPRNKPEGRGDYVQYSRGLLEEGRHAKAFEIYNKDT